MRKVTYERKYNKTRTQGMPVTLSRALKAELAREIKKAVNCWLENNQKLGAYGTVKEYITAWHNVEYDFTLNPKSSVKVTLYATDQTFTQGYTQKPLATYRITKTQLFN